MNFQFYIQREIESHIGFGFNAPSLFCSGAAVLQVELIYLKVSIFVFNNA
jgi:hypothetical protein